MTWAVEQKCDSAGQKLVLLMLSNYCNSHTGQCNPSHQRLAEECCMGTSTLKRHLASLADNGVIEIIHRANDGVSLPNQYILKLDGVGPNRAGGGSKLDRGVGPNRATNQEYKPVIEPSLVADATSSLVSDDNEPKKPSPITSAKLAELYHRFCPSLPRISDLSDQRRKAMKARWIQAGKGIDMYDIADLDSGLEWWRTFFQVVEASDFLTGRVAPSGSREKPFRANIDWLLKPSNFLKVVEGNYDNEVAK